jgi:methionyl-tRNA formyltransferase
LKLGVLVSGNLGLELLNHLANLHDISFVMTDKKSTKIIEFCYYKNIDVFIGNPRSKKVEEFILNKEIETLISVNYLFLIDQNLINLPRKIAFNVHGSLLPKYRGRTPHVWSIINNEQVTGITAHLIDEGCDSGDIIEQVEVKIDYNDTGNDILNKFQSLYSLIIDKVLYQVESDSLNLKAQNNEFATYFGKRAPEDGQINWGWQKERIRNWVRALAFPYPGAFAFIDNVKVIVDEVEFVEIGFNYDTPNGTLISLKPLLVKTPNGIIELKKIRTNLPNQLKSNILN